METISMVREGSLDSKAVFTAEGFPVTVTFDKKAKLAGRTVSLWEAVSGAREIAQATSFGAFNGALAASGLKVRFVGGGKGEKTLQLVADSKEAIQALAPLDEEPESAPDPAELHTAPSVDLMALQEQAQMIDLTFTETEGADTVRFDIEGERSAWFRADGSTDGDKRLVNRIKKLAAYQAFVAASAAAPAPADLSAQMQEAIDNLKATVETPKRKRGRPRKSEAKGGR